jgi:hypothetical protein
MSRIGRVVSLRWRLVYLAALALLICAGLGCALALAHGTASAASPASPTTLYPDLSNTAPTGLLIIEGSASAPQGAEEPVWRSSAKVLVQNWPLPSTIRRLARTSRGLTSWIAESSDSGICVLLSPNSKIHGTYAVGTACTGPGTLSQGTYLTYHYPESNTTLLAGVAPSGTRSVEVAFAGGETQTVPVDGNGWSLETANAVSKVTLLGANGGE